MNATAALLYASLACSAGFFVLTAIMYVARRPPVPPSLPAMSDLGPEPPAIANLLANGGVVTADAVPATLFDLAARKVIQIEETEPRHYQVRVGASPADLTRYESRVMRLLKARASGSVVPAGALTLGSANEARGWLRGFRSDVSAEARSRGLAKPRWPAWVLTLEGLLVFGAFILAGIAGNEADPDLFWGVTLGIALGTAWVSSYAFRDDSQIVTAAGLQAAARSLSLRRYLHDDELFPTLPPTAVVVRGRYIAYGAALGVAAAAVRAIPMGAEDDHRAWSSVGGRWRQVKVSYPTVWPPAYGVSPGAAVWAGARFAGIGALALWAIWFVSARANVSVGASEQVIRDIAAGAVAVSGVLVVAIGVGLWLLLAGAVSLFGSRTVTGDAIRLRQFGGEEPMGCYLAVDDGSSDHVRAWKVAAAIYDHLTEYETVTVTVTPLLSHVRGAQRAPAVAPASPAAIKA